MSDEIKLSDLLIPDYDVKQYSAGDIWVAFVGFTVHLNPTDEGLVVDVWESDDDGYPVGDEPTASTYAFYNELEEGE